MARVGANTEGLSMLTSTSPMPSRSASWTRMVYSSSAASVWVSVSLVPVEPSATLTRLPLPSYRASSGLTPAAAVASKVVVPPFSVVNSQLSRSDVEFM